MTKQGPHAHQQDSAALYGRQLAKHDHVDQMYAHTAEGQRAYVFAAHTPTRIMHPVEPGPKQHEPRCSGCGGSLRGKYGFLNPDPCARCRG